MVKSWVVVTYDGNVLNESNVVSLSFSDQAGRKSDKLDITVMPDMPRPTPDAEVTATFYNDRGQVLECGTFYVQTITRRSNKDLSFSASSVAFDAKEREKRSEHYTNTKLSSIINIVGERLGKEVRFEADDQAVSSLYQTKETDINFLDRIAQQYDVLFSIKNGMIYFVNKSSDDLPLYKIDASKCKQIMVKHSTKTKYRSCEVSYYDVMQAREQNVLVGKGDPVLQVKMSCKSEEEAELKGKAKLAVAQRGTVLGSLTMLGQAIHAGTRMALVDTYNNEDDAEYSAKSATHSFTRSGGWSTGLEFENFKIKEEK